ncbi:MAG: hypothetical protein FD135_3106 [Comamonadaceae bacterium]|nr:MAG: hypothetical protein FD135_3106 [Comamonadaceae bacterium]
MASPRRPIRMGITTSIDKAQKQKSRLMTAFLLLLTAHPLQTASFLIPQKLVRFA